MSSTRTSGGPASSISEVNPAAGATDTKVTDPGATRTVTVPPSVGTDIRRVSVAVVVGVVGTEPDIVDDDGVVVEVDDEPPVVEDGPSTSRGVVSLGPSRSSAKLTICQVTAVAPTATTSQSATSCHRLTGTLSRNLAGVARVVLIEDDVEIRRLVAGALATAGHDVESSDRALDGLELIVKGSPDVVLMDLGLPDIDGTELLRMIRAVSSVPVIVITARRDDETVVATLDSGADDHLVKPFSVSQLEARIRAVLRRGAPEGTRSEIAVGGLVLNAGGRTAALDGSPLDLSPKEFDLLRFLMENEGRVVSKREVLAEVWREPYGGADRTIDVHVSWLRKKLGETAHEPRYIQTVHGVGIKLVDPSA